MKTKILVLVVMACLSFNNVKAQWASSGSNIAYTFRNVGIGTISPQQELHVVKNGGNADLRLQRTNSPHTDFFSGSTKAGIWSYGTKSLVFGTNATERMLINNVGNVGIGTSNPTSKLEIRGGNIDINDKTYFLRNNSGNTFGIGFNTEGGTEMTLFSDNVIDFTESDRNNVVMRIVANSGNVGIGTKTPDSKLTVKGKIHAQEVLIDLNGVIAPDYVFESDYDLRSLSDTEEYIKENKHLPEIPSAKEMEKKGVELKILNLKLLQKIEELTLHIIAQDKRIQQLEFQQKK